MRVWLLLAALVFAGCVDDGPEQVDDPPFAKPALGPVSVVTGEPCDDTAAPSTPATPVATSGPGPGMVTVRWSTPASDLPVVAYDLLRNGKAIHLGNTLSFGDHAAGASTYQVVAIDACGNASEPSGAASGTPLPGLDLLAVGTAPLSVQSDEVASWPIRDMAMNATGQNATWRIIEGTGNCCENYVITTPAGRIIDFGGTFLHYSDDEGKTWQTVQTIGPYVNGEGAITVAPNGDVVAVGWDPYSGDRLWSHKYVAADDQWYYQTMPLHQPFYDRAWVTAVKGPFIIQGQEVPYLTFVESNFHGGTAELLLRSLDGLHYAEFTDSGLTLPVEGTVALPSKLPYDIDRDWSQPISQSPSRPIGHGLGLQQRSTLPGMDGCHWRLLGPEGDYACPTGSLGDLPRNQPLYVDAAGNLHHFIVAGNGFGYRMSPDMGATWHQVDVPLPEGYRIRTHDQKVSAHLDQAVFAAHGTLPDGTTGDFVVRFRDVTSAPVFEELLQVGAWDAGSDAGLGGDRRFDFMTVGFLLDGRVVLSFTDGEHHPPALAVEQPH